MHKSTIALLALPCLLLAPPAGNGQAARTARTPPPRTAAAERPVPFKAGEQLLYDVSWSSYLTAGSATLTVKEKRPSFNSVAYYIVAEGQPTSILSALYSLYYKADTLLDAYTLLPQRGSLFSQEGKRRRMKITRFDHDARRVQFEVQTATIVKREGQVPAYTQDALSAVYVLRALPLKNGTKMTMPVSDGGATYQVQVAVAAREQVKCGVGTLPAWRVLLTIRDEKGRPFGRDVTLWLSDDARRLPLRMQAALNVGTFNLTLRTATGA